MNYGLADVLDDGRFVVSRWKERIVDFGSVPLTLPAGVPTWLGFARATLAKDGKAYVVGKGMNLTGGDAFVVCEDGRWLRLAPTAGDYCVALTSAGPTTLWVTIQVSGTNARKYLVDLVTLTVLGSELVAIAPTAMGFSNLEPDGTPILTDPVFRMEAGKLVGYICSAAGRKIAQDDATGNPVISDGVAIGTLAIGDCFEPHLSPNGKFWVCRAADPVMLGGMVPATIPPYVNPTPPPLIIPTFKFNNPLLVTVVKDPDGVSGAPGEIVVNQTAQAVKRPYFVAEDSLAGPFKGELQGVYSETLDPTVALGIAARMKTRLMHGHDSSIDWIPPVGQYRPWDSPALELYRLPQRGLETLEETVSRWRREATALLTMWAHDCAVMGQAYLMGPPEVWSEQEVLDALGRMPEIVNMSPRFKHFALFAFRRGTIGIEGRAGLTEALKRIIAASPGLPIFTQVGEIPEEPQMQLPAKCYVELHNSNIAAVVPGTTSIAIAYQPQEYGAYQQVEVTKSKEWTSARPLVLVRFIASNRQARINKVLAQDGKFDECLETWDPAASDADSSWQQFVASGPYCHATADSKDGKRQNGVCYTLTCVDETGKLFR